MKIIARTVAAAAALLTFGAVDARAQLIELPMGAGTPQGLTAHQIRVVQFALRDTQCYTGPISGRWTAATRTALQCARQRTSAADAMALSRELALWSADATATRTMAGDVAPSSTNTSSSSAMGTSGTMSTSGSTSTSSSSMGTSGSASTSGSMGTSGTTGSMGTSGTTGSMPMRDSTMMRGTMGTTGSTTMSDSSRRAMPMTPTDPLSPMSRTGTTTARQDSLRTSGATGSMSGSMSGNMSGTASGNGSMLVSQVDSVIMAAEAGLTNLPPAQAAALLGNIATELDAANSPALSSIATDLRSLRTQLTATPFDAATVGRSLTTVSGKVETAAGGMSGEAQTKLMRLATLLGSAGRQLAPQE